MADDLPDDELEGILDDALDAFDAPAPRAPLRRAAQPSTPTAPVTEPPRAEEAAPDIDEGAARAFEDALKALGDLNVDDGGGEGEEADLKLVEEFMASLGTKLPVAGARASGGGSRGATEGAADMAGAAAGGGREGVVAPDVEKLVESIVGHLLSEDVLKGPMQQMRASYAEWLPKHRKELSAEELRRYSRQQELVGEICERYERGGDMEAVMGLLSKMQETGSPPEEVMKGLSVEGEGGEMKGGDLDKMAESCGMQ